MESLMNMGCDAVVIMGCDTEGSAAAIEELGAAGIPVIIAGVLLTQVKTLTTLTLLVTIMKQSEAQGQLPQ